VTPGREFGRGGEGFIRLALVPDVDGMRDAMSRWNAAQRDGLLPA
jgi:bifunctional pyridoxal-dependent enzyme with beta-cystathionase and maltose regulon repressor activities